MSLIDLAPTAPVSADPDAFLSAFGRSAFRVAHRYAADARFSLSALEALAVALPAESIEYNAGDLDVVESGPSRGNGLSAADTIRQIAARSSWMVLQNVEQVPAYRALMDDCLAEIRPLADRVRPGMCQPEAFIFLSSAGATTPYHMDPEHGFLLQVRGRKVVTVFDGSRSDVVTAADLERFYGGVRERHMPLPESARPYARTFTLGPGDGLYIPVTHPHYVQVEAGDYSVSFSVTFRTPDLYQRADRHYFNGFLRQHGLTPGNRDSALLRRFKAQGGKWLRQFRRLRG